MKPSLRQHLTRQAERLADLDRLLADPALAQDSAGLRQLGREHRELQARVERATRHARRSADRAAAEALRREAGDDAALRALAEEEIADADAELARLEAELERLMLPRDPDDGRDAFLEIRAGTGGDESALFAGDLLRMYLRHAERQGWQAEILSASPSELGGYREVIVRIAGEGVYGRLKFESGGHRVQRVPATESQGRIHTSACTVAVMAEPDEAEAVTLNPAELRIDTFRASGAGGQHINKTDSAVRVTHLPTGLVAECQDDRSQHRNKARALAVLAARLRDKDKLEREAREAATRRALVGSGDRSDRIRTYNLPQGRLTDHRIGLTLHQVDAILDGELGPVTEALVAAREAALLAALAAGTA